MDEQVAAACEGKCGNRGASRLDSIDVTKKSIGLYDVVSKVSAKFHQHTLIPEIFGGTAGKGFDIEYAIKLTAYGTLDASTCRLTIDKVNVSGDSLGIANGAKSHEGKTHLLKNCKEYI